jgi:hypothetical protein
MLRTVGVFPMTHHVEYDAAVGVDPELGLMPTAPWGALGTHNNEKRRLTLEDVERRFRMSDAVSGT